MDTTACAPPDNAEFGAMVAPFVSLALPMSEFSGLAALRAVAVCALQTGGGAQEATGCGVAGVLGVQGCERDGPELGTSVLVVVEPPRGVAGPGRPMGSCGPLFPCLASSRSFATASESTAVAVAAGAGGAAAPSPRIATLGEAAPAEGGAITCGMLAATSIMPTGGLTTGTCPHVTMEAPLGDKSAGFGSGLGSAGGAKSGSGGSGKRIACLQGFLQALERAPAPFLIAMRGGL